MTIYRSCIAICIAIGLSACGGGDEFLPETTLTYVSSFPTKKQKNIPVSLQEVTITVNEDIDPLTITNENVHLMPGNGERMHMLGEAQQTDVDGIMDAISGTVHFDPTTKTIHFKLNGQPLQNGTTYHIRIHNVKLLSGQAIKNMENSLQFEFTVAHLHELERKFFDKDTGVVIRREENEHLTNGELSFTRYYKENNELIRVRQYKKILPGGRNAERIDYAPDFPIVEKYRAHVIENEKLVGYADYIAPGPDNIWGNDDDLLGFFAETDVQHHEHMVTNYYKSITGTSWAEKDIGLTLSHSSLTEHNSSLFEHRHIFYQDFGTNQQIDFDNNGNPAPIDDLISSWHLREFDPNSKKRIFTWSYKGNYDRALKLIDPNLTAQLFGEQNGVEQLTYYEYTLSPDGKLELRSRQTSYSSPGPDNDWRTLEDNAIDSYWTYEYDINNNEKRQLRYIVDQTGKEILVEERIFEVSL